jgi:hypothetical protein
MSPETSSDELLETSDAGAGTWAVPGSPVIRYRRSVLESIGLHATKQFLSIPRGGIEIGGVLFGTIDDAAVTISDHREFSVEYLNGPSYILAESDRQRLSQFLETAPQDPELADLEVVGWYRSHTRSEVLLTAEDRRVFDDFFPGARQVALSVKPFKLDPAVFGFFFREESGTVKADSCYRTFTLLGEPAIPAPAAETIPPKDLTPYVRPIAIPVTRDRSRGRKRRRVLAVAGILAGAAAVGLWSFNGSKATPEEAPVQLRVSGPGPQLSVTWDGTSAMMRTASYAELQIIDGKRPVATLRLSPDQLRSGAATYLRESSDVEVRMRIHADSAGTVEETAFFVAPPATEQPTGTAKTEEPNASQEAEKRRMQAEIERLTAEIQRITPHEAIEPVAPPRPTSAPRAVSPQLFSGLNRPTRKLPDVPAMLPPTPEIQLSASSPATPALKMPAREVAAFRQAPRSGRAIWTGELRKGGLLMLDSSRPSIGTVTGEPFEGPGRVRVYPAELVDGGITIYTADARHRQRPVVESPAARNGWNVTSYIWDPQRSAGLTVLEAPNPQNGWRRLSVRNTGRPISMVVIDWEQIPE